MPDLEGKQNRSILGHRSVILDLLNRAVTYAASLWQGLGEYTTAGSPSTREISLKLAAPVITAGPGRAHRRPRPENLAETVASGYGRAWASTWTFLTR